MDSDGVYKRAGILCTQPGGIDDYGNRNLPGGSGHEHHQADCIDVQNDGNGHSSSRRYGIWRNGLAGKYFYLFDGNSWGTAYVPPDGGFCGAIIKWKINRLRPVYFFAHFYSVPIPVWSNEKINAHNAQKTYLKSG